MLTATSVRHRNSIPGSIPAVMSQVHRRHMRTRLKTSIQKYEIAQNCPSFSSLPLPFPTMIAFHRVKKSPLIIGIVDRIKINSESELIHTFCKLHVSTYFTSVSFISRIAQIWINLQRQHVFIQWLPRTQTSLSRWKCARKGRREGHNGRDCTLPMVPCGSSPVARLYLAKNKAPEEELIRGWYSDVVKEDPSSNWLRKCQEEEEEAVKKGKPRSRRFSFHKYFTTFFIYFFASITLLYIYFFLYIFTHDIYPRPTKFSFTLDLVT